MAINPLSMFGFEIRKKEGENASFVPKASEDGEIVLNSGGIAAGNYGTFIDFEGSIKNEAELVTRYRDAALFPEVESAIDDIINEMIVQEAETDAVELVLDRVEMPDAIKKRLIDEFNETLRLLEFNTISYDVCRRWYIDGRIYYHGIIDEQRPQEGIKELRYIDPRKIKKVREIKKAAGSGALPESQTDREYFVYAPSGFSNQRSVNSYTATLNNQFIKIAKDSIIYCSSGMSDSGSLNTGFLHKALKPLNQLKAMEDSLVIYRISRESSIAFN